MKRFFTKTGIWLLGGAAVIAVVLCIISALGSGTSLLHNALGVIASPFRSAGAAVVAWVDGIGDHFASIEDLQAENEALRQENAQLEAACEQARQEAECASAHAEQLRQELARHAEAVRPVPVAAHTSPQPEPSAAQSPRPEPEAEQPPQPGPEAPQPAQPDWKPQTRLEHLSVELMNWFDDMMGA